MQKIIWVPGLQGKDALSAEFAPAVGVNEKAVRNAAHDSAWHFQKMDYQSRENQNPLLGDMQINVHAQLKAAIEEANGSPIIVVGSSVGFGVAIGALERLKSSTSPIALIGFKPVPDPLMAIELQIGNPEVVRMIQDGRRPAVLMPVEGTDGKEDTFLLTEEHLNDIRACRILSDKAAQKSFNMSTMNSQLRYSKIIFAKGDHLTPSPHMIAFAGAVTAVKTELIPLDGFHGTDYSLRLYSDVREMVARFG